MWPHQIKALNTIFSLYLGTFGIMFILFYQIRKRASPANFFSICIAALWLWLPLYFFRHPIDKLFTLFNINFRHFLFYIYYASFLLIDGLAVADLIHSISKKHRLTNESAYNPFGAQIFWLTFPTTAIFVSLGYWRQTVIPATVLIIAGLLFDKHARKREQCIYAARRTAAEKKNRQEIMANYAKCMDEAVVSGNFNLFLKAIKDYNVGGDNLISRIRSSIIEFGKRHGIASYISAFFASEWQPYVEYPLEALREFNNQCLLKNNKDTTILALLKKGLQSSRADIRVETIRALGLLGIPDAKECIRDFLVDTDKQVRVASAEALDCLGEPKWEKNMTGSGDLLRLAKTEDPSSFNLLVKALKSKDSAFRTEAVEAIASMHDYRAAQVLVEVWKDINGLVEKKVLIKAFRQIPDARIIPQLITLIGEAGYGYDMKTVIAEIQDEKLIDTLLETLKTNAGLQYDILSGLLDVLGMVSDKRIAHYLADFIIANKDEGLRNTAFYNYIRQPDVDIVAFLLRFLEGTNKKDIAFAAGKIVEYVDGRANEVLWKIINSGVLDDSSRTNCICALVKQGDLRVADIFIPILFNNPNHPAAKYANNLFGDYNELILDAAAGVDKIQESVYKGASGNEDPTYTYSFNISRKRNAVRRLCEIKTALSSNILYQIAGQSDATVVRSDGYYGTQTKELSFLDLREMARKELSNRNNPKYESIIYIKKESWLLQ